MPGHACTSTGKPNIYGAKVMLCIWWDHLGVVYCELLKLSEANTGDQYRMQLMRLSRVLKDKWPQYQERQDKVILQHDNSRPHVTRPVKTYLEMPYSPDVDPSVYHLFRSKVHGLGYQHFLSHEEVEQWMDSWIASKYASFFRDGI